MENKDKLPNEPIKKNENIIPNVIDNIKQALDRMNERKKLNDYLEIELSNNYLLPTPASQLLREIAKATLAIADELKDIHKTLKQRLKQ